MAELLKNYLDKEYVKALSNEFKKVSKNFNQPLFLKSIYNSNWNELELKERISTLSQAINFHLTGNFKNKLNYVVKVAPKFNGLKGFVFPDFIEKFGLIDEKNSLLALEKITQYSTGEFAIRPFINQNQNVMQYLLNWSTSENFHVRRLSSEGCRPLLPWATKLNQFVHDPSLIFPILENLKEDSTEYVRKSVANNLNDISKNHPEKVLELCAKWKKNNNTSTNWIIRHGLRTLLKNGDERALEILGYNLNPKFVIEEFKLDKISAIIGEKRKLSFTILNLDRKLNFRLELLIKYVKKNNKNSKKIFQIGHVLLVNNEKKTINYNISFKDLSTRKHYEGTHEIFLKVNGKVTKQIEIDLIYPR